MIAPLLLVFCTLQRQDAPIQKQSLQNGVVLYAEEMPKAHGFTLDLFVSALGHEEPVGTAGQRHLLEHLLAKGQNRDLNAKLEVRGVSLSADTLRDGIRFELEGPSEQLPLAIESLNELIAKPAFSNEEIAREINIVKQEFAVRSVSSRLTAALWKHAYGDGGSDPYGTNEGLATATPDSLTDTFLELFKPSSMTVTVVGDIDAGEAISAMTGVFQRLGEVEPTMRKDREKVTQNTVGFAPDTPGSGRAVFVPSFDHASTLPALAAAFAIAAEIKGAKMVYTPTPLGGLVSVVHPRRDGLDGVDGIIRGTPNRLFAIGRAALRMYVDTIDARSREKARMYGQMLLLRRSFSIERVRQQASPVSQSQFQAALQKFRSSSAIRVGGTR